MKKSTAAKKTKQKTNYVFFFALAAAGLVIGSVLAQPITSVLRAEGVQLAGTKSTITWDKIKDAQAYVIYLKAEDEETFTTAINVPGDRTQYTIENLDPTKKYEYKLSAVNAENKEFLWTPVEPLP